MDDIKDYLHKRASELGLERGDQLQEIQSHLDTLYPGQCRAVSINDGVLKIRVSSSSMASTLRYNQLPVLRDLSAVTPVSRLVITQT